MRNVGSRAYLLVLLVLLLLYDAGLESGGCPHGHGTA